MNDKPKTVSYFAYESMLEREDRQQRRMIVVIIVLASMLFVSVIITAILGWKMYKELCQFDVIDEYEIELDSEGEGNANYIGEDGNIYNGTSESNETQTQSTQNS